jgi:hypothetical protein
MTTPTIREIKRYFEMYPDRYQAFKRKSDGLGPRKWVERDVREWATPHGREVWREPQPARLWHWMREVRITDDWRLLARMSPEYQPPPPPPAPPAPPPPPEVVPPSQIAARIIHSNPYIIPAWNRWSTTDKAGAHAAFDSLIDFALANPAWRPGEPILDAAGRPVSVSVNVDLDIKV